MLNPSNEAVLAAQEEPVERPALSPSTTSPSSSSRSSSGSTLSPSSWLPPSVSEALQQNPVFSGGAGLAAVGVLAAGGREALRAAVRLTRKYCTVSLEIPSKDRSYQWMLQWLSKQHEQQPQQPQQQAESRLVRLLQALSRQQHLGVETTFSQSPSGVISTRFDFVPSPGEHTFWYRHRLIHCTRTRDKSMLDMQTGSPWETVTLRCFGRRRQIMLDLLSDAKAAALRRQENKTIVYTSSGVDWRPFGQPRRKRPLESVVLDAGVAEAIQRDFADFLASQRWYVERGIPYRRGYLLFGPPGCGKCFAVGTQLRLFNGDVKAVETFVGGEELMGDDGLPRFVTPGSLTRGHAVMYRIQPGWEGAAAFTVNGDHILVLNVNTKPTVENPGCTRAGATHTTWKLVWWEVNATNELKERSQSFNVKSYADAACAAVLETWTALQWEVSVNDYIAQPADIKRRCKLFQSEAVSFQSPRLDSLDQQLSRILKHYPSPAQLGWAAWYLGLWVTDGIDNSDWIVQCGPSSGRLCRQEVMIRLLQYRTLFGEHVTQESAERQSTSTARVNYFKFGMVGEHTGSGGVKYVPSKALRLLLAYGLINNKHIPQAWICDILDVRRHIFAGLLDCDGSYDTGELYEVCTKHRHVTDGLKTLAGSLGIRNGMAHPQSCTNPETGEVYDGFRVSFIGDMWDITQYCALTSKQCPGPGQPDYVENKDSRCYGFSVTELSVADYYGFAVHGGANRRFLLHDFTVTHNVRQTETQRRGHRHGHDTQLIHSRSACCAVVQSSFIQALAGAMAYNICVLNLNERSLTDDKLAYLLSTTPPRSLVLLEDVDAAFSGDREGRSSTLVTFSGLLNALDGVASTEERITFLTTNHRERLDAALIRPGRVDVQVWIGMCSAWQMMEMWRRFYGDSATRTDDWMQMGRQFVEVMARAEVSVAELQGFFLLHKDDAKGALAASREWRRLKDDDMRRSAAADQERERTSSEVHEDQQHSEAAAQTEPRSLQEAVRMRQPPSGTFIISK